MSEVCYRDARRSDLPAIAALFRRSFGDTFGHLYDRSDLDAFLGKFTAQAWLAEFDDPAHAFRVVETGGQVVGYAKLGPMDFPIEVPPGSIELRQIYFDRAWLGRGLSRPLMDWVIDEARKRGAPYLYLSVFIENHRAQALYRRYGFTDVCPYAFMVGNHADEDIIMRKRL